MTIARFYISSWLNNLVFAFFSIFSQNRIFSSMWEIIKMQEQKFFEINFLLTVFFATLSSHFASCKKLLKLSLISNFTLRLFTRLQWFSRVGNIILPTFKLQVAFLNAIAISTMLFCKWRLLRFCGKKFSEDWRVTFTPINFYYVKG